MLVFSMALKHLDHISFKLIENGRNPDEPAAAVCRARRRSLVTLVVVLGKLLASAAPAAVACRKPRSVSGKGLQPPNRP